MMDWLQTLTIIGVLGSFTMWIFNRLDTDIKSLSSDLKNDMRTQNERIDRLYQMFVDLLKEKK